MNEYLKKYPKEKQNIGVLLYSFGFDETDKICKQAITLNKKIKLYNDLEKLDLATYNFI